MNNCWVVYCRQFVNFICRIIKFSAPIKYPVRFSNLFCFNRIKSCHFCVKNLTRYRILNRIRQLINLEISFYIWQSIHPIKVQNLSQKSQAKI